MKKTTIILKRNNFDQLSIKMKILKLVERKKIYEAAKLLVESTDAIALTGAGVSTESGIPDFRGEGGIWEKYKPEIYGNIKAYLRDPTKFWKMAEKVAPKLFSAEPNPGHTALADLEDMDILKAVITQNIDELHQKAGSVIVYEVHGNINRFNCFGCRASYTKDQVLRKLKKEKHYPPQCDMCSAPLKPSVVLFGEALPTFEIYQSQALAGKADIMLIAGSSLSVDPVADLPMYTLSNQGKLIIVNDRPTYLDEKAEVVIHHKTGTVLPLIVEEIKKIQASKSSSGESNDSD
ncbi:MAG: NAD-dependent protein deacylase [Candidatus Lokiarchaeota archaeon]|nr:NAD-dependent protein deacylase [Candidatus Lokiarchaeota archaeon]MBD3198555.1 NAD-dependent protein deacylase [Candidatus Lokiarchaeota archaeon]